MLILCCLQLYLILCLHDRWCPCCQLPHFLLSLKKQVLNPSVMLSPVLRVHPHSRQDKAELMSMYSYRFCQGCSLRQHEGWLVLLRTLVERPGYLTELTFFVESYERIS